MNHDLRKNQSGYPDPTAFEAIVHADKEANKEMDKIHKLVHAVRDICELSGFQLEGRIVLKDKKTGKVYR